MRNQYIFTMFLPISHDQIIVKMIPPNGNAVSNSLTKLTHYSLTKCIIQPLVETGGHDHDYALDVFIYLASCLVVTQLFTSA